MSDALPTIILSEAILRREADKMATLIIKGKSMPFAVLVGSCEDPSGIGNLRLQWKFNDEMGAILEQDPATFLKMAEFLKEAIIRISKEKK